MKVAQNFAWTKKNQKESYVRGFFHYKGIIHYEFIPESQTINKELYLEILKWLLSCNPMNTTGKMGNKHLVSFTQQCSSTSCCDCEKLLCKTQCYHSETPTLHSWPRTNRFLPVSTAENEIERTLFYEFRWGDRKYDKVTAIKLFMQWWIAIYTKASQIPNTHVHISHEPRF